MSIALSIQNTKRAHCPFNQVNILNLIRYKIHVIVFSISLAESDLYDLLPPRAPDLFLTSSGRVIIRRKAIRD